MGFEEGETKMKKQWIMEEVECEEEEEGYGKERNRAVFGNVFLPSLRLSVSLSLAWQ